MPVERMRMRPWLEEQIDRGMIPGLKWVNREKKIFQIPWMHAARHGWDVEKDAPLFRNWAIHTGKYQPGVDKPDPKTWKANFRCAMNSLPDIEEVKDKSMKKGSNAFRVYKMLSPTERPTKKGKKRAEKEEKSKMERRVPANENPRGAAAREQVVVKMEDMVDSTVLTDITDKGSLSLGIAVSEPPCPAPHSPLDDNLIISDLPDVCQTIEVTTEDEEQSVSSSHPYPLQISPISSYGESDTDSIHSEEDSKEGLRLWSSGRTEGKRPFGTSVLKMPTCTLPGMATFVTSGKTNFKVTSSREESPLIAYNSTHWGPLFSSIPAPPLPTSATRAPTHENRASVIMKTSDVSSSTVKTC
ncbi:interferon regulatory factor 2a isoform X1 [Megalops cyprinoides]|uniref:interferon regulatory factor 2a isoform X1 n=1 Tax=Megalops cyprinoides TaxID=118141 RepID=UPI001865244C|nr:interferon regulatory factor 2a isoform X1 [Megalops cyprinoides]